MAPVVRNGEGGRELVMARWGMPTPPGYLKGHKIDRGVTNIRNPSSTWWKRWEGVQHRCLVPLTAFSEPEHLPDGTSRPAWFARNEGEPLAFFAGIWCRWTSVRKLDDGTDSGGSGASSAAPRWAFVSGAGRLWLTEGRDHTAMFATLDTSQRQSGLLVRMDDKISRYQPFSEKGHAP